MGDPQKYPRASGLLLTGSIVAFLATVLLIISFSSPYWLESYPETYAEFIRLGLWDVCFHNYRHPPYQFDKLFDGCHWIFSLHYLNIRDWLQPGWMMLVQAMMCLAVIFSLLALIVISLVLMRFLLKFEILMLISAFILEIATAVTIFLAIAVFGGMCYDRSWLQYPTFNHLSWAYGLAVVSCCFHAIAAGYLFSETSKAKERRRRANTLVYNMHPRF